MKNHSHRVEYLFLLTSIAHFRKDLRKISEMIKKGFFAEEELHEIMGNLLAVKENIEALEKFFLR